MKKNLIHIITFIFLFSLPFSVRADVSKFAFTTNEQTIPVSTLSEAITIQAQGSDGSPFPTPETIDLTFTSTSATGEFLNSSGNPATKFMSTNTSNRTFYYRDSVEGSYTITVKGVGRTSGKEWSANQHIVVGTGAGTTSDSSNNTTSSQTTQTSSSSENSGGGSTYISLGNAELDVSSGADRVTTPGNALLFQATVKKNKNTQSKINFNWSFGDGHVGAGERVSYAYKYPGVYAVVLNASDGTISSVSRIKVTVTDSVVTLANGAGYIDITNTGNTEINLFGWKIEENGIGFIFQPDTIILPHATMRFDKSMLSMKGDRTLKEITLKNSTGMVASKITPEVPVQITQVYTPSYTRSTPKQSVSLMDTASVYGAKGVAEGTSTVATSTLLYEKSSQKSTIGRVWGFVRGIFKKKS